jgi:DNA-binding SARP family transcriptional activator/TolB-like protein
LAALDVATNDIREAPPARLLAVRLLGDFAGEIGGRQLPLATRKAKAIAAYLALSDNAQDTRERLVGLLWSESDEERARGSLRQAIHEIKQASEAVGFAGFRADKQALALARGSFVCDVHELLAAVTQGVVHPRLLETQRITDTLLEDFDNVDPAFYTWILAKRQLLLDRLTLALEALLAPQNDPASASAAALALLNLDPTHEMACRHLIRIRASRGDIGGAMKAYKTLWDLLETDYDIEPSKETQELIVGIKQQAGDHPIAGAEPSLPLALPAHASGAATAPRRLFISICSFDVGGVPEDRRYVVTGFRHELVACLARFREWSVRTLAPLQEPEPRTWSSPPEYLIEGSAYVSGGAIRLVITFSDAATSVCIWSERYTITLPAWFETQQNIVRQVAMSLNIHLSAERLRRFATGADVNLDIHDRWLRGQALLLQMTSKDWPTASGIFERLIVEAPDFSPALSGMVQINNTEHIAHPGRFRDLAKHAETLQLAQRAVHLDPLDSRARLSLAWSHQLLGRVHESTLHAALAVDLNETDPWTLVASGQIWAYCGDYDRAKTLLSASLELTSAPIPSQMAYSSSIKFLCSDYAGCVEAARQGLEASPGFSIWPCAALGHLGHKEEARITLQRTFERIAADWHGQQPPTHEGMVRWLLHMFPIAVKDDWERLATGLAAAGAPIDGIEFGVW